MDLSRLIEIFSDNDCTKVYVKILSPNDNSKNQVYLAGSFDILNIFPLSEIISDNTGERKTTCFKSKLSFYWITEDAESEIAPNAQLILYPDYPEVRFSGFLKGCENPPSELMASRMEQRVLFLGVSNHKSIYGYVAHPESEIANEFRTLKNLPKTGLFSEITIERKTIVGDTRPQLLRELLRIHNLGWIKSKRLTSGGIIGSCESPNCGGYTLEAELGVTPNGYSEPDYLGWEVKQFGVDKFSAYQNTIITLMTPEPTGGYYKEKGVADFVRTFGYPDKKGRADRINFGGIFKYGIKASATQLTLTLEGYDKIKGKITDSSGCISIRSESGIQAASWSFTSLLEHWNRKHSRAVYVPSLTSKTPYLQYHYGKDVILGNGADFNKFLALMASGEIYYDPAIKLENASTAPKIKRRSQFRIKSGSLADLYIKNEVVDLSKI